MTIKELKKRISVLPDDMRIYADDGGCGLFSNNSEFVATVHNDNMFVLQTKMDFDVNNELTAWYHAAEEAKVDKNDFWDEFYRLGYDYNDLLDQVLREEALRYKK